MAHGRIGTGPEWFDKSVLMLKYFAECVELRKKVRIVVDYDPQEGCTIQYFRATDEESREEETGRP